MIILSKCWTARCPEPTTHVTEVRIVAAGSFSTNIEPHVMVTGYCLKHARHFAYLLVENYDHEYEILDIRPVKPEEIKDWDNMEDV